MGSLNRHIFAQLIKYLYGRQIMLVLNQDLESHKFKTLFLKSYVNFQGRVDTDGY